MDYTSQLNIIIGRLNDLVSGLTSANNLQSVFIGILTIVLVLNAIKGE